jgi:HPt (histidine-containing phosphotransfer) domain-containing protein
LFFNTGYQLKDELFSAIDQSDFGAIEKCAHKLNGAAGNFGFGNLCAALTEIEALALDGKEISELLTGQLEVKFTEATEALNLYMAEQASPPQKQSILS